ncbi:MAG TPA: glycosyl hydrolase [Anaerolineaceae bacterium]
METLLSIGTLSFLLIGGTPSGLTSYFPIVLHSNPEAASASQIYWGANIAADTFGLAGNPPYDMQPVSIFEAQTGKAISILHWEQRWQIGGQNDPFSPELMDAVRQHGAYSLLDWLSEDDSAPNPDFNRPQYSLSHILDGSFDGYIRQWASDAKAWGYPFFLRFDYEMNGDWLAWSERVNGNQAGQYVQAWRHVHDIFTQVGASNVTWVWCPNVLIPPQYTTPLQSLYPGNAYVDWTCMDGYNWGINPARRGSWQSFGQIFHDTYTQMMKIAPGKPMMLAEIASSEDGGNKAAWIRDALTVQIPHKYPRIKAVVWFNVNRDGMDWVIETSPQAQSAFAAAIRSTVFTSNQYANTTQSPISSP